MEQYAFFYAFPYQARLSDQYAWKNTGAQGQYAGRRSLAPGQPLAPVFFQDTILRLRANVRGMNTYPGILITLSTVW